jgi:hypothetical protein
VVARLRLRRGRKEPEMTPKQPKEPEMTPTQP